MTILDRQDCWSRGLVGDGKNQRLEFDTSRMVEGICCGQPYIVDNELIDRFCVEEGVKVNSDIYCQFLTSVSFMAKEAGIKRKKTLIWVQDNAPSLASGYSKVWLEDNGFCTNQLMQWPANSPDLNPIESPW